MNYKSKSNVVISLILVALVIVLFFVLPDFNLIKYSFVKYSNKFFLGFISIIISIIINSIFTSLQINNNKNTALTVFSWILLILSIAVELYCTFSNYISFKLGTVIVVATILLSIVILIVINVTEINKNFANKNLNNKLQPYKELLNKVDSLVYKYPNYSKLKELYDEMKYSDPSSTLYVSEIEEILSKISNDNIDDEVDEIMLIVKKRNNEIKLEKHNI